MKNKKVITVLLLIVIGVVVAGIYFVKNPVSQEKIQQEVQSQEMEDGDTQQADVSEAETEHADITETTADADFSLAVTELVDYGALSSYGLPIIVDYGSDSCIPCKEMAPVLEKINEEMQGKAFIKFVDVWKYADAANNVPIQLIPTQVLVTADGKPFVPSDELAEKMEFIMYNSKDTGEHVFTVHQGGITEEQMRMGIVTKEMAITDESNKKKVQYNITNHMFRFWFKFVPDGTTMIELGKGKYYYEHMVKGKLHEYMGNTFEAMCRHYMLVADLSGKLPYFLTSVGKWWGSNPLTKEQTDIDVVALDPISHVAVLGECKFKNEPIDKNIFESLLQRKNLINKAYKTDYFVLFSLSGFSKWITENAEEQRILLVDLKDMYTTVNNT